jgi:uncharacterized membrane protein YkoI
LNIQEGEMKKTILFSAVISLCIAFGVACGNANANDRTIIAQAGNNAKAAPAASKAGAKVISEDEAKKIALKAVPGKVQDIAVEKKLGEDRYVVEIIPAKGGKEVDVVIHMTTGKVLAIEN